MGFNDQHTALYMDKIVKVKNLRNEYFSVKVDGQEFIIEPNGEEDVPMWLAKHILRHGKVNGQAVVEIVGEQKVECGVCQQEFADRRALGAHSLSHRKLAKTAKE